MATAHSKGSLGSIVTTDYIIISHALFNRDEGLTLAFSGGSKPFDGCRRRLSRLGDYQIPSYDWVAHAAKSAHSAAT
jgi:hypothetical protein